MGPTLDNLLRWLDASALSEAELIRDPDLNRMLDPWRLTGPLPYRCARQRCPTTITYWALATQDARVVPGPALRPTGQRVKGNYPIDRPEWYVAARFGADQGLVGGEADLLYPGLSPSGRFPEYVEWAMRPDSTFQLITNPDVKAPYPLRFRFTCPNRECNGVYRHTNRAMLRLYLGTVYMGKREVRPTRI